MTLPVNATTVSENVGQLLANILHERYGNLSGAAKRIARALRISEPTARNLMNGHVGAVPTLFEALLHIGQPAARKVLADVIGPEGDTTARLHHMEASLKEFAQHVEAIRVESRAGRARMADLLAGGNPSADRSSAYAAEQGYRVELGAAGGFGRDGGPCEAAPSVQRKPLDAARGSQALGPLLNFWREKSGTAPVTDLIAYAKDHPRDRIGISREEDGALVYAHISPAFRLYSRDDRESLIGLPLTLGPDHEYAEACSKNIKGVLDAGVPLLESVVATVKPEPGVSLRLAYDRLILPWKHGNGRFAVVGSQMAA